MTVHGVALPDATAERTGRGRRMMWLVVLACAAPVLLSYFAYYVWRPDARGNYATLIQPPRPIPAELPLRAADGAPVSAATLKGQWLLVVVSGAACDARCENLLYAQRQLREMTGRERGRIDKIWLVTDDAPVRPGVEAALHQSGSGVLLLRAPRAAVAAWLAPEAGRELEDHLYVVDPYGAWMMRPPPMPDSSRFKRDLDRLLRASAFWDREGRS